MSTKIFATVPFKNLSHLVLEDGTEVKVFPKIPMADMRYTMPCEIHVLLDPDEFKKLIKEEDAS